MRIMPNPCNPGESSASPEIIASIPIAIKKIRIRFFIYLFPQSSIADKGGSI